MTDDKDHMVSNEKTKWEEVMFDENCGRGDFKK
jgi:hypothetical protein